MSNSIKTRLQLKHDTLENWLSSSLILSKGEVAFAEASDGSFQMRVGDGEHNWSQLSASPITWTADQIIGLEEAITSLSTTHYEANSIEELSNTYNNGDTAVIKTKIGIDALSNDILSYTAYIYDVNLSSWKAMDGNYSAENVYFPTDITAMYTFGKFTGTDAKPVTIPSSGKNIAAVFTEALTKVNQTPSVAKPSCSISMTSLNSGDKEIGTTISGFTWSRSYTDGSYGFGRVGNTSTKTAGCILSSANLTCDKALTDGSTSLSATSGTAYLSTPKVLTIGTNTLGTMNLTCGYEASPYTPANNIGQAATGASSITGGTCTASKSLTQSGFRYNLFIGTTTLDKTTDEITSDFLKRVEKKSDGKNAFDKLIETTSTKNDLVTTTRNIIVPVGAKTIVIAAYDPDNKLELTSVLNTTVNADMVVSFKNTRKNGIMVNGATSDDAYKSKFTVWTFNSPSVYEGTAALTISFNNQYKA